MSNKINHEKLNKKILVTKLGSAGKDKPHFVKSKNLYVSTCATCLGEIKVGQSVKYFPTYKVSVHWNCKNL